jgi:hypothetical protein
MVCRIFQKHEKWHQIKAKKRKNKKIHVASELEAEVSPYSLSNKGTLSGGTGRP